MNSIVTYKASAGSGKTYTLVYEYIKFLFNEVLQDSRLSSGFDYSISGFNAHRRILAVTFTNKSTAEMKIRIIEALYNLSIGNQKDYQSRLIEQFPNQIDTTKISSLSRAFLFDILQDYSGFRVQTIDGFFQQVVRSFARELNLNSEYQVELDTNLIKKQAVDELIAKIDFNQDILDWLTQFSKDNIAKSEKWFPRDQIDDLSDLLFQEKYIQASDSFRIKFAALKSYCEKLKAVTDTFEASISQMSKTLSDLLDKKGIEPSFFKRGVLTAIIDKKTDFNDSFIKAASDEGLNNWVSKGKLKQADSALLSLITSVRQLGQEYYAFVLKYRMDYGTAALILKNIYITGILGELSSSIWNISRTNNLMVISSANEFINRIVSESSIPFIYEKIGTTTNHFLIDEFQDTSQLQWKNFLPLLADAVASGHESLLVGDVKQSIYRWRNGDWKILHSGIKSEFVNCYHEKILNYNFRSRKNIVAFNNFLFTSIATKLDEYISSYSSASVQVFKIGDIYSDVVQTSRSTSAYDGHVKCTFIEEKASKAEWKNKCIASVIQEINYLSSIGFSYKDISILISKAEESVLVANALTEAGIPFISQQSMTLDSDRALRFIISILRYFERPHEELNRAELFINYNEIVNGRNFCSADMSFIDNTQFDTVEQWEYNLFSSSDHPNLFSAFQQIKNLSLLKQVQGITQLFSLFSVDDSSHNVFIQSFLDLIEEYQQSHGADLKLFLEYWQEFGKDKSIPLAEDFEGVNIITIHKSKGLEFDIVFIPFCDWMFDIYNGKNYSLLSLNDDYIERENPIFPFFPVNLKGHKLLYDTHFSNAVNAEFLDSCLDVLNKLYVAVTRAKTALYINFKVQRSERQGSAFPVTFFVLNAFNSLLDASDMGAKNYIYEKDENNKITSVQLGKIDSLSKNIITEEAHITEPVNYADIQLDYPVADVANVERRTKLQFRYANDFFDAEVMSYREYGTMMHKMLSNIVLYTDVDHVVKKAVEDGVIHYSDYQEIYKSLEDIVKLPQALSWFDGTYEIINERDIISIEDKIRHRPDRIMFSRNGLHAIVVDYKFGSNNLKTQAIYENQLKEYMSLLSSMGYVVSGKIFYARSKQIIDIVL